jgi:tRNA threonylcarbamoyladenosine biosynthesis protein TsaE
MINLGKKLVDSFYPGDLVILEGALGAGKTTLTKGIALGMGISDEVTSPTFVISRVHSNQTGKPDLVHVDAYRLGSIAEVESLDLESSLDDAITVVEWGTGLIEGLTDESWLIKIYRDTTSDESRRDVEIIPPKDRKVLLA